MLYRNPGPYPQNNSGKEKLPSKRKKPSCCWPAGWKMRRRGGQIEKRRDHKSSKYNQLSIQEMFGSVGSEVGQGTVMRLAIPVDGYGRQDGGEDTNNTRKCNKEKIVGLNFGLPLRLRPPCSLTYISLYLTMNDHRKLVSV